MSARRASGGGRRRRRRQPGSMEARFESEVLVRPATATTRCREPLRCSRRDDASAAICGRDELGSRVPSPPRARRARPPGLRCASPPPAAPPAATAATPAAAPPSAQRRRLLPRLGRRPRRFSRSFVGLRRVGGGGTSSFRQSAAAQPALGVFFAPASCGTAGGARTVHNLRDGPQGEAWRTLAARTPVARGGTPVTRSKTSPPVRRPATGRRRIFGRAARDQSCGRHFYATTCGLRKETATAPPQFSSALQTARCPPNSPTSGAPHRRQLRDRIRAECCDVSEVGALEGALNLLSARRATEWQRASSPTR